MQRFIPCRRAIVCVAIALLVAPGLFGLAGISARAADPSPDGAPVIGAAAAIDGSHLAIAGQRLKLYGIDAPDVDETCHDAKGQDYPCGVEARAALASLVQGRSIACQLRGPNQMNETLARCRAGTVDLARALIDAGWAIADRARSLDYETPELAARTAKRGIWQGRFVPPADWRAGERVPQARPLDHPSF